MKPSSRSRKQQLVREAIYNAAIELFAENGFDATTVEEIAQAAGVSRRSFFRYYASKDDLLAQSVVSYGHVLAEAITACGHDLTPLQVIRATVMAGVHYTAAPESRTRQVVAIAAGSSSARQAHASRMMDIEDVIAAAYRAHFKDETGNAPKARLLAGITLATMGATILSWFKGEHADLATSAKHIFADLGQIFGETLGEEPGFELKASLGEEKSPARATPGRAKASRRKQ